MSFPNRGEGGGPPLGKNSHIFPFFFWGASLTSLAKSLSTFSLLSVRMTGAVADEVRVSSGPRWESPDDPETSPSATAWLARVFGFSVDTAGAPHHQCSVPGLVPDVAKIGLTSAQARAKSPKLDGDLPLLRTNSEMLRGYAVSGGLGNLWKYERSGNKVQMFSTPSEW